MRTFNKDKTIEKFKIVHNYLYDYSTSNLIPNGKHPKINIICKIHGEFIQRIDHHLSGSGCQLCKKDTLSKSNLSNITDFVTKANTIHNNFYDYSKSVYKTAKTKLIIVCPIHGEFKQTPDSHLANHGCKLCGDLKVSEKHNNTRKSSTDFINEANRVHNNLYDYSNINYINNKTKINIICTKHGEFKQTPSNHLFGKGCPTCNSSKGEIEILKVLSDSNINFIEQHTFDDLYNSNNTKKLRFDFYIPELNVCIEFDGIQHYEPIDFFGGEDAFKKQQLNDNLKNEYCKSNNIKLIRIKEVSSIKEILKEHNIL